jgi:hypothetical protein
MDGSRLPWKQKGFHKLNKTEVQSSGSPKGNPDRSPVVPPLKIFHNRGIVEVVKIGEVFQSGNAFIYIYVLKRLLDSPKDLSLSGI